MRKAELNIIIIAAVTLDGRIARNENHFTSWTSKEDKDFLHKMLSESDCVIVGNNTYKTAIKPLSKRNCIVFSRSAPPARQKFRNCVYLNPQRVDIVQFLKERGYYKINVLGGTETYSWFLEKNLIDEIYLTVEPVIFGAGLPLFEINLNKNKQYILQSVKKLNKEGSLLLHYMVHR